MAFFGKNETPMEFKDKEKIITLNNNGLENKVSTRTTSVSEFLEENNIKINEHDLVLPNKEASLFPGMNVEIKKAAKIIIEADGKKTESWTYEKKIENALRENDIILGKLDKTEPPINTLVENNLKLSVIRINIEEKTIPEEIAFKTITKKDSKMGWQEKKIEQKGEKGIMEIKYKITYKNGQEVSRVILDKTVSKEPQEEITIQGTYMKIGASHKGQGTWYAFKGGMFAASPWLPMGSYAKVTNQANGKSIVVQINDRGPFGDGRIIDLDKVAFQKIASLGAGVINVKVEEILN